jgi:hypothetical protein
MVNISLRVIARFEKEINNYLEQDNGTKYLKMENEGCTYPCVFLGKKKYFGIKHIIGVNFDNKLFIKGIEVIKQGKSGIEKKIGTMIMKQVVNIYNDKKMIDIVKDILKDSININNWSFDDFKLISRLKKEKTKPEIATFMNRMKIRYQIELKQNEELIKSGKDPKPLRYIPLDYGEKFSYVLVKNDLFYDHQGRKINLKKGDIMEYYHIAKEDNLPIDIIYYITHFVIGTCARFISSDDQFMPKDTNTNRTEDQIDVYSINAAKNLLNDYIRSLSGLTKEKMAEMGKLYKRIFKEAINISSSSSGIYKNLLAGPITKLAFDDSEELKIIDIIFEFANKEAIKLCKKGLPDFCKKMCEILLIDYKTGYDINNQSKYNNLIDYLQTCKNFKYSEIEDIYKREILNMKEDIDDFVIKYKTNLIYIIEELKKGSNGDYFDIKDIDKFYKIWVHIVSLHINKCKTTAFKDYLNELKRKKIGYKPSNLEIKNNIKEAVNKF